MPEVGRRKQKIIVDKGLGAVAAVSARFVVGVEMDSGPSLDATVPPRAPRVRARHE